MKRYCFALDLKDDPTLIAEYRDWHQNVWPEIKSKILESGVKSMDIYLVGNRMFMIMDTTDAFDLHQKAAQDNADARVQEWEELMWKYQKPLPFASPDEKWLLMEKIFELR